MTSFDTMTDTAKLFFGVAISIALIVAGVALLLDAFGALIP